MGWCNATTGAWFHQNRSTDQELLDISAGDQDSDYSGTADPWLGGSGTEDSSTNKFGICGLPLGSDCSIIPFNLLHTGIPGRMDMGANATAAMLGIQGLGDDVGFTTAAIEQDRVARDGAGTGEDPCAAGLTCKVVKDGDGTPIPNKAECAV
tara:strand:- start:1260 stop:1715 length:456 start_codon:yes stop_codon:yes gene_type:complete